MPSSNDAVRVQGFREIQRALGAIGDGAEKELRQKLRDIGETVALVAASNAPRDTGELQHSIRTSSTLRGASVYSNVAYGGAVEYGAWTQHGRGPHIKRADASHYMHRAVTQSEPFVDREVEALLEWVAAKFEEGA